MKKIYHLGTCSTCKRIISELDLSAKGFEMQDIKTAAISETQLDELKEMAGSYESLFSRRSMKYRPMGLHEMELKEEDYKKYILEEYSFLKRPVIVIDDEVFVGNSKKVVAAVSEKLG